VRLVGMPGWSRLKVKKNGNVIVTERKKMMTPRRPDPSEWTALSQAFPNLVQNDVWITDMPTNAYNCIAWALGYTDRWINPPADLGDFEKLFLASPLYTNVLPAEDSRASADGYRLSAMTHASRFHGGSWTSKLGASFRITHNRKGVTGALYGQIVVSFS